MKPSADPPLIFCAVDTGDINRALMLSRAAARATGSVKLGLEFFNAHGPAGVRTVMEANPGLPLFLDLKFHDIPNTVARAVRAVVPLRPAYINVHAAGGAAMMRAARDAAQEEAEKLNVPAPRVLAVTVLTSLDDAALNETGQKTPAADQVVRLARLAQDAGLDGVVCSAHEIAPVRKACGGDFVLMVPGIRPAGYKEGSDDQRRTMTPREAMRAGATHLVIGRPITDAPDPEAAARAILAEISGR